jgi:hypothetical protein
MIRTANAHGYTVALGDCYPFDVNIKNATIIRCSVCPQRPTLGWAVNVDSSLGVSCH